MVSNLKVDKIQSVAGTTTAMTFDSAGRVSLPNQPSFAATKSAGTAITASNAGGGTSASGSPIVVFDTLTTGSGTSMKCHNIGNHYNSANGTTATSLSQSTADNQLKKLSLNSFFNISCASTQFSG